MIMTCSCYASDRCTSGYCPVALYFEYGPDFGDYISCDDCCYHEGSCDDCMFEASEICPLSYVLAEAEPVW